MASVGNPLAFNESNAPNFGHSELYPLIAFVHWCTALGVATEKAVHRELVCGCCLEGDAGGRESAVFEGVQRCCRKQVFGLKKSRNCCSAEDLMERYLRKWGQTSLVARLGMSYYVLFCVFCA